jgi:hypothetical protein
MAKKAAVKAKGAKKKGGRKKMIFGMACNPPGRKPKKSR